MIDINKLEYYVNFKGIDLLKDIKKSFLGIQSFTLGNSKHLYYHKEESYIDFYINKHFVCTIRNDGYFIPAIQNKKTSSIKIDKWLGQKIRKDSVLDILQ